MNSIKFAIPLFLLFCLMLNGCNYDENVKLKPATFERSGWTPKKEGDYRFLYLAHTYDWTSGHDNKIDKRLEYIDFEEYDGFWLGGDICSSPFLDKNTADYLDDIFDLSDSLTHYALGNHDYRNQNLDFYYEATARPDFYTHTFKSLTLSVMNTNLLYNNCHSLNSQYEMLSNVLDTISASSHYVLLMHHQIFKEDSRIKGFKSNSPVNYPLHCYTADADFFTALYPKLMKAQKKGVQVVIVVGDTGWHKGSEVTTPEGVVFLASGINNTYFLKEKPSAYEKQKRDKVLEFTLSPSNKSLTWEFVELNKLTRLDTEVWAESF